MRKKKKKNQKGFFQAEKTDYQRTDPAVGGSLQLVQFHYTIIYNHIGSLASDQHTFPQSILTLYLSII